MDSPLINPHRSKYHVEIDWEEYYLQFEDAHGGRPIMLEEQRKILFRDGWMYNAFDHSGPEYPPPTDWRNLIGLKETYWSRWLEIYEYEIVEAKEEIRRLRDARAVRSLPLPEKTIKLNDPNLDDGFDYGDDGGIIDKAEIAYITDGPFTVRLNELERDRQECLDNLKKLAKEREHYGKSQIEPTKPCP